jgi:hypothetical protein
VTRYEIVAVLGSVTLASSGLVLDVWFPDCLAGDHWLMRSGALITVAAIVFIGLELRKRLERAVPFVKERFQHERPGLLEDEEAQGHGPKAAEALVERIGKETESETEEVVRAYYKRILRIEVALLISGTVIWGLGDIPVDLWRKADPPTAVCVPHPIVPAQQK